MGRLFGSAQGSGYSQPLPQEGRASHQGHGQELSSRQANPESPKSESHMVYGIYLGLKVVPISLLWGLYICTIMILGPIGILMGASSGSNFGILPGLWAGVDDKSPRLHRFFGSRFGVAS